jgi:eukaryotic-like serine/threonine-protein kinase
VKPQNVLIDPEGRAKVTDFGIALSLESDGLTKTGRVLGTTDYVSPEQAMGKEIDARSDIYSLGIVLWEMLVGDVPFKAETLVGVAMKHVNEPLPDVQQRRPGVSSALAAVVERAARKDPRKRYPDMGAMLSDLEAALEVEIARAGGASGEATTVLNTVPGGRRIMSARTVSVAGILLVLAAFGAALVIAGLGGDGDGKRARGEPPAAPSGTEVELVGAQDFDPGGGDGEHPEEVDFAIDGDPTGTEWSTENYDVGPVLADAAGKEGVGLIVETAEPVEARELSVTTSEPGWTAEVYAAADGPPADLEGWGEPLGELTADEEESSVTLTQPEPSSFYLVWITELADASGGYSAAIGDVSLTG